MKRFDDLPLRNKLIWLMFLVVFVVLVLSTGAGFLRTTREARIAVRTKLISLADMIGTNCIAPLNFRDPAAAALTLRTLSADASVTRAWVLDVAGRVFAEYGPPRPGEVPPDGSREIAERRGRDMTLSRRIVQDGDTLGTVILRYDLLQYRQNVRQGMWQSLIVLVGGLAVALLLALFAQRTLSVPIRRLVDALGRVTRTNDLSIRIPVDRHDEIGVLARDFNAMLAMIHSRESDRDRAEEALRESETKYRTLVENAKDGIVILQDYKFVYANPSLVEMSGVTLAELIGAPFIGYVAEEERDKLALYYESRLKGIISHSMYETVFLAKDGRRIHAEVNSAVISFRGRPADLVIIRNINERKKAEAEIRALNESLERRVEERTRELAEANERLIELDRLKSMFLASMSHELRTPLNSILGFTGLLLMGMSGALTEEQVRQLNMVQGSAQHLLELINEVLDISKIESGRVDLDISRISLVELAREAVEAVMPLVRAKGLVLAAQLPAEAGLESDRRRVKQVLMNLLGNAVKFSDRGEIRLRVEAARDEIIVSVSDQGPGIRAEDMAKLFHPFGQIDMSSTKAHEGTGLGLYLCKKILGLLDGAIEARSEYGHGSTFLFRLPRQRKESSHEDGSHH